jgi:hypothetical protein
MIDSIATSSDVSNSQPSRHSRGEVGVATAGQTIKQLWWASKTTNKTINMSLKRFARQLLKDTNKDKVQLVKDWLDHKNGSLNAKRSDKNQQRVNAERSATKLAKKAKKGQQK